jgi:hypothetical protein
MQRPNTTSEAVSGEPETSRLEVTAVAAEGATSLDPGCTKGRVLGSQRPLSQQTSCPHRSPTLSSARTLRIQGCAGLLVPSNSRRCVAMYPRR